MKKIIPLIIISTLILAVTGCGTITSAQISDPEISNTPLASKISHIEEISSLIINGTNKCVEESATVTIYTADKMATLAETQADSRGMFQVIIPNTNTSFCLTATATNKRESDYTSYSTTL